MSQIRLPGSSPVSKVYIPSSPLPQAAENSIIPFLSLLELEFRLMLEKTHNRSVFNQAKKAAYRRWLKNLDGQVKGNTINSQNRDQNMRHLALN